MTAIRTARCSSRRRSRARRRSSGRRCRAPAGQRGPATGGGSKSPPSPSILPEAHARAGKRGGIGTPRRAGGRGVGANKMADPTGFEPAISSVTGWHVGPLHHGSVGSRPEHSRGPRHCRTSRSGVEGDLVRRAPRALRAYTRRLAARPIDLRGDTVTRPTDAMRPGHGRHRRRRRVRRRRQSSPSRSGRPTCSARTPASSWRPGRWATSSR